MKNRKNRIILTIICLLCLIGIALLSEKKEQYPQENEVLNTDMTDNEDKLSDEVVGDNDMVDEPENHKGNGEGSGNNSASNNKTDRPNNEGTQSNSPYVKFPYTIPETTLVVEQINSYSGMYFENGLDSEVENVAAIVLKNSGNTCIEYFDIHLFYEAGEMQFKGSTLEPGAKMIVMEANIAEYKEVNYLSGVAEVAYMDSIEMSKPLVSVEEGKDGGLDVKNISKEDIPCVRIFYKFYMKDLDVYLGGITYTAKIVDLSAGETKNVLPSHYEKGFSKVVMIKTYETAE